MATAMARATRKELCVVCSPKQTLAIISCKGCLQDLCRKHFNEHRDTLSQDLHNVFDRHDGLLQEVQVKIDRAAKPLDNENARAILKQIDEWETITAERVMLAAKEARAHIQRLFNRQTELDQLKQKIGKMAEELKEQQESESFVETDIDYWLKQIEQLKTDLHRPSQVEINPPVLQIQNIDWTATLNISTPTQTHENYIQMTPNQYCSALDN